MAIDDLLDEHEQGEKVRTWLRENGAGLIGGVALGLALIGGWQWWQKQQGGRQVAAGEHYRAALEAIEAKDLKQAAPKVAALHGVYATLAALDLAKAQLDAGQRDAAIATLHNVKAGDPALAAVVQQRLARLLIDAGKADQALTLLPSTTTDANTLEIRGDAQSALGHRDLARNDYSHALTQLEIGSPQRRLLEMKLSDVGGAPAKPEAKS
jgi:predicted negative regulator of RcsB-dependent stress response